MDSRIQCVVVDADDCEVLARFWSQALGWRIATGLVVWLKRTDAVALD